jgi:hypothetical protein
MNKIPNEDKKFVDDLPKGTHVLLSYGEQKGDLVSCDSFEKWLMLDFNASSYKAWEADLMDNKKGTIRFMNVFGWETELGDTYSHKVIAYMGKDGFWHPTKLSKEQEKCKELERGLGL